MCITSGFHFAKVLVKQSKCSLKLGMSLDFPVLRVGVQLGGVA
jgi:hypothetical protein